MKNYFIFILKSAFFDFSRNKGRTFLTSLGILIGVLAVVLLIALGLGLKKYINDQFEALGKNSIFLVPGKIFQGGNFRGSAGSILGSRFDLKDVRRIERIKNVTGVGPLSLKTVRIIGPKASEVYDIFFSSQDVFSILNLEVSAGREFTKSDVEKKAKVVVMGSKIAEKLFGESEEAIGKKINADNITFSIIGILKSKGGGGMGGFDYDSYVYAPYTTGYIFNPEKKFVRIFIKTDSDTAIPQIKQDLEKEMLKRYKEEDFSIVEPTEILSAVTSIFNVLNIILVAIAAISLLVGGIGIMNIMYVTVTERIKEIGIRRALGARRNDILYQFLVEAVILSLLGGLLGLGIAFVMVFFVQGLFPAYIDAWSVVLALGVSSLIGIVFGVFPAKRAADLSPIEAIRYE